MTTTIRLPRRLLTTMVAIAAIAVAMLTAATVAFATPDAKTMTWFLPAGVDPGNSSTGSIWPQSVSDPGCAWAQVDTYRYATQEQRNIVDHLADDGLLTLVTGHPEDSAVYLSHFYRPPAAGCGSTSTTTAPTSSTSTPSTSTTTPTETETTSSTPPTTTSATEPPSTTSSTSTMPSPSTTSSTTSATSSSTPTSSTTSRPAPPTTSTPPSSTSSTSSSSTSAATPPSSRSPRPSERPTAVIGRPATGELARTGSDLSTAATIGIVVLGVGLLVTGFFVIINREGRRTDEDES